ncbi:hypothetical protein [Pseudomonas sp. H3_G09]
MNSEIVKGFFSLEVYKGGSVSTLETNEVSISHQESSDLWFVGAHFGEPGVKGPIIALSFMKSHKAGEYEIAPGPSETVTSASMGEGTIGGGGFHEQGTGEMTLNEITSVEPNLFLCREIAGLNSKNTAVLVKPGSWLKSSAQKSSRSSLMPKEAHQLVGFQPMIRTTSSSALLLSAVRSAQFAHSIHRPVPCTG